MAMLKLVFWTEIGVSFAILHNFCVPLSVCQMLLRVLKFCHIHMYIHSSEKKRFMLDEMTQQNACHILGIRKSAKKIRFSFHAAGNKKLNGFSYFKNVANFEAFFWSFSSSTNPEIVRSEIVLLL